MIHKMQLAVVEINLHHFLQSQKTMATSVEDSNEYDSYDDQDYDSDRPTERWAPLGAASNPEPSSSLTEQR